MRILLLGLPIVVVSVAVLFSFAEQDHVKRPRKNTEQGAGQKRVENSTRMFGDGFPVLADEPPGTLEKQMIPLDGNLEYLWIGISSGNHSLSEIVKIAESMGYPQ